MTAVRHCILRLRKLGYLARYPGGVTLRLATRVLILRWSGYVPDSVHGRRVRVGRFELHARRV